MRRKNVLLVAAILSTSFLGGMVFGQNAAKKVQTDYEALNAEEPVWSEKKIVLTESVEPSPTATPMEKPSTYFLVLSDKEICVYELPPEGDAVFIYARDVEINQLRQEDYERLCRGIKVESLEEARALTEDFGS